MPSRCCEFVDSRLRRSPPDRASAAPYGQAGEKRYAFPPPCPQVGGCPQASQHSATRQDQFDFGEGFKPAAGYRGPLAYSSPEAVQTTGTVAHRYSRALAFNYDFSRSMVAVGPRPYHL